MNVKNFASFCLWDGDKMLGHGSMEELIKEANEYAEKHLHARADICFMEFDKDVNEDDAKVIKGQVILSYHRVFEDSIMVVSGK